MLLWRVRVVWTGRIEFCLFESQLLSFSRRITLSTKLRKMISVGKHWNIFMRKKDKLQLLSSVFRIPKEMHQIKSIVPKLPSEMSLNWNWNLIVIFQLSKVLSLQGCVWARNPGQQHFWQNSAHDVSVEREIVEDTSQTCVEHDYYFFITFRALDWFTPEAMQSRIDIFKDAATEVNYFIFK